MIVVISNNNNHVCFFIISPITEIIDVSIENHNE